MNDGGIRAGVLILPSCIASSMPHHPPGVNGHTPDSEREDCIPDRMASSVSMGLLAALKRVRSTA